MEKILIHKPAFTMSEIFKSFEPKTTAFGGVATGSIKAQEAARVAPVRSIKGSTPILLLKGRITGSNIAVVAIFEVISVNKFTLAIIIANTIKGKGVSFIENEVVWHHKLPSDEEYKKAIEELNTQLENYK